MDTTASGTTEGQPSGEQAASDAFQLRADEDKMAVLPNLTRERAKQEITVRKYLYPAATATIGPVSKKVNESIGGPPRFFPSRRRAVYSPVSIRHPGQAARNETSHSFFE